MIYNFLKRSIPDDLYQKMYRANPRIYDIEEFFLRVQKQKGKIPLQIEIYPEEFMYKTKIIVLSEDFRFELGSAEINTRNCELRTLYVHKRVRHLGIGTALFNQASQELRCYRCNEMKWVALNTALPFYEKMNATTLNEKTSFTTYMKKNISP